MTFFDPEYMIVVSDGHAFKAHRLAQDTTWRPQLTDSINPDLIDFSGEATSSYVTIDVYQTRNGTECGYLIAGGDPCPLCAGEHRIAFWQWTADDTSSTHDQFDHGIWILTHTPCPACRVADYRHQYLAGRGQR